MFLNNSQTNNRIYEKKNHKVKIKLFYALQIKSLFLIIHIMSILVIFCCNIFYKLLNSLFFSIYLLFFMNSSNFRYSSFGPMNMTMKCWYDNKKWISYFLHWGWPIYSCLWNAWTKLKQIWTKKRRNTRNENSLIWTEKVKKDVPMQVFPKIRITRARSIRIHHNL